MYTKLENSSQKIFSLGDNLPPPKRLIEFLAKDLDNAIPMVRSFDPDTEALAALSKTNLIVALGTKDGDIPQLASSIAFTEDWLEKCVTPYMNSNGQGTKSAFLQLETKSSLALNHSLQ